MIKKAMILAAGLGTRMRPITHKIPKPLVKIADISLLERAMQPLIDAGIRDIIINIHHLADKIEEEVKSEKFLNKFLKQNIIISDEREKLLDSAGGIIKALPLLGDCPFLVVNADTFFIEHDTNNILHMEEFFNPKIMDILLLTVKVEKAIGIDYADFTMRDNGQLRRAPKQTKTGVVHSGILLLNPKIFKNAPSSPHSLNHYFDKAISKNRLYGLNLSGHWYTVGTVSMIKDVEALLKQREEP